MNHLRNSAARERRAPILWWLLVMAATGGGLVAMVHDHSRPGAILLGILLAGAWAAPLVALSSMAAPRRAKHLSPAPGEGTYDEWMKQARLLGRVLIYYDENPDLPPELRRSLHAARVDLHDTFRAHPLQDDLERVCGRIREGALKQIKDWFGREYRRDIRELANEYEQAATADMDPNLRLLALQSAVEKAAAMMSRNCMPRMLERERLACATDCSWLAVQAAVEGSGHVSPVDLAEMLVIEWSDFSEPWQPAHALRNALARMEKESSAAPPAAENVAPRKLRRVRVRVRMGRKHRPRRHRNRGPSMVDVLRSFGQWLRYSVRAWMLYR
jgi:hypothetical protein